MMEEQYDTFQLWVNNLLDEGYDLSDYTLDEVYDIYERYYGPNEKLPSGKTPSQKNKKKAKKFQQSNGTYRDTRFDDSGTETGPERADRMRKTFKASVELRKTQKEKSKKEPYGPGNPSFDLAVKREKRKRKQLKFSMEQAKKNAEEKKKQELENIKNNHRTAPFSTSASLDTFYSTAGEAHMATVYGQPIDLPVPNFPEEGKIPQRVSRHNFARAQAYSTFHSSQTSPLLNITTDGKQLTYRGVMRGEDQDLWGAASGAELIKLIVERKTLVPIHKHEQPADQRKYTTYYNPQVKEKLDDNGNKTQRVRGTFGGNKKCAYDGPTSSPVADITFIKIHWNSVVSDRRNHRNNSRYATVDITDFYLMSSLEQPEWINIPIKNIPLSLLEEHNLIQFISDEHILCRVDGTMYGHPVAGRLANADLVKHLAVHGYVQDANVPCMFAHVTAPISFSLVVNDFGIKYVHDSDLATLYSALRKKYQIRVNLTGSK